MKLNKTYILTLGVLAILLLTSCSDDEDLATPNNQENEENEVLEVNQFIEDNMSIYYFWNQELPEIDIEEEDDPEEYFNKLLKKPDDRWSFITDNYEELKNYLEGIQKSTGYSLLPLYLEDNSNQIVGFIEYVHNGSPAEEAGLKRGDMVYRIDGQTMTDENYTDLLNRDKFDITLATINTDNSITELSPTISIEAIEMSMDPIIASSITDTLGHKIGYLAYSSFLASYEEALVDTLKQIKEKGITDMILDLRYNGGGSVGTAALLGDILVPSGNEGNTFIQTVYNELLTQAFEEEQNMTPDSFKIKFEPHETKLDLNTLYVLTTASTASASEMIIYGLEPYMNVVQIGETTHGKYYGSSTFHDEEGNHNWAIQPIILKSINANNNINYSEGLPPDHQLEDIFYLFPSYELGNPDEVFMAKAISVITGEPFIYEDVFNNLKSSQLKKSDAELREKLYPKRSEMWINP